MKELHGTHESAYEYDGDSRRWRITESHGVNAGASAALASGEVTIKHSGWSATGGLTAGIGVEGHVGIRDDDKDGRPELCARVAYGVGIGGLCVEMPVVIRP